MLFASTAINYMDRQTLSLLAPYLKISYHWTNSDYADLVIAFRVAYAIGQTFCGRWMDRIGTRLGISCSVLFYSIVSVLTPLANGFFSFMGFRLMLGLRRVCELACRNQGRVGMVPGEGAGARDSILR